MKLLVYIFILIFLTQSAISSSDREIEIYKNIRCLVCQGQSLNDSNSDFANDLKKIIKDKIDQNETDKQIYKYLVDRFGDWILFDPPVKITTVFLWIIPLLVLILGFYVLKFIQVRTYMTVSPVKCF